MREKAEVIETSRSEAESKSRAEDDMRKQLWRAKSLGLRNSKNCLAKTRGVKADTKSAFSEAQARAKTETDIRGIFDRTRAAAMDKTKENTYVIEYW